MFAALLGADFEKLAVIAIASLFLIVIGLMLRLYSLRKTIEKDQAKMRAQVEHLDAEIRTVIKADIGLGKRIIKNEERVIDLSSRQDDLSQEVRYKLEADYVEQSGSKQIANAQKLVGESEDRSSEMMPELSKEEQALSNMFVSR